MSPSVRAATGAAVLLLSVLAACGSDGAPPPSGPWAAVAAGEAHTLALRKDGTLWAFGANDAGQLGDGSLADRFAPVQVGTLAAWEKLAAGGGHSAALTRDGVLHLWGGNASGQLGDGTRAPHPEPAALPTTARFMAVSAGPSHTAAIRADGTLWTWGRNGHGQVGDPASPGDHLEPFHVGTGGTWTAVAAGGLHTVALRADGTLWAWGSDFDGQLGVGAGAASRLYEPAAVPTTARWRAVAAGRLHTVALREDGTLWASGTDARGQLGRGPGGLDAHDPVPVATAAVFVAVAPGGYHSLAIRQDGTLWAWGDNVEGQLGIGSTDAMRTIPVQVGTASDWVKIAAGRLHSLGIRADGSLWAWGYNGDGEVGDGSPTMYVRSPVRVGSASDWSEVAAGGFHSLGRRATGLYAWGLNVAGQLGDGTRVSRNSPVQVGTETTWGRLAAGYASSYAIRQGTLYAWGENAHGQLGTGTPGRAHDRSVPARVP